MSRVQSISSRVLKRSHRAFSTKPPTAGVKPAPAPVASTSIPPAAKPAATTQSTQANETKPNVFIPVTFGVLAALAYYFHNNKDALPSLLGDKINLFKAKDIAPPKTTPTPPVKPQPAPEAKPAPVVVQESEQAKDNEKPSSVDPKTEANTDVVNEKESGVPESTPEVDVIIFDDSDVPEPEAESEQSEKAVPPPIAKDSTPVAAPVESLPELKKEVVEADVPVVETNVEEPKVLESVKLTTPPPEDFVEDSKEKARQRARQLLLDEVTQILQHESRMTEIDEVLDMTEQQLRAKVLRLLEANSERAKAEALRLAQFSEENNKRWQEQFAAFVDSAKKQMQEQAKAEVDREREKLVASLQAKFDEEVALARKEIEKLSRTELESVKSALQAQAGEQANTRRQQLIDLQSRIEASKAIIAEHNNFAAESTRVHRIAFGVLGFSHAVNQAAVDPKKSGPIREYAALKAAAGDDPVIQTALQMIPEALVKNGIPSLYQLQSQFNKIHREGRANVISKHGTGIFGQAMGFAFTSVLAPIQSGFDKIKQSAVTQSSYIKDSLSDVADKLAHPLELAKPVIDPIKNFVHGTYNNIQVPKPNVRGVVESLDQATTGADEIKSQVKNIAQDTLQKAGEIKKKTVTLTNEARVVNDIFDKAEYAIANGDLKTAISLLKALKGEEGAAVKSWMEQAQLRVDVQDAVDIMVARANLLVFSLY